MPGFLITRAGVNWTFQCRVFSIRGRRSSVLAEPLLALVSAPVYGGAWPLAAAACSFSSAQGDGRPAPGSQLYVMDYDRGHGGAVQPLLLVSPVRWSNGGPASAVLYWHVFGLGPRARRFGTGGISGRLEMWRWRSFSLWAGGFEISLWPGCNLRPSFRIPFLGQRRPSVIHRSLRGAFMVSQAVSPHRITLSASSFGGPRFVSPDKRSCFRGRNGVGTCLRWAGKEWTPGGAPPRPVRVIAWGLRGQGPRPAIHGQQALNARRNQFKRPRAGKLKFPCTTRPWGPASIREPSARKESQHRSEDRPGARYSTSRRSGGVAGQSKKAAFKGRGVERICFVATLRGWSCIGPRVRQVLVCFTRRFTAPKGSRQFVAALHDKILTTRSITTRSRSSARSRKRLCRAYRSAASPARPRGGLIRGSQPLSRPVQRPCYQRAQVPGHANQGLFCGARRKMRRPRPGRSTEPVIGPSQRRSTVWGCKTISHGPADGRRTGIDRGFSPPPGYTNLKAHLPAAWFHGRPILRTLWLDFLAPRSEIKLGP